MEKADLTALIVKAQAGDQEAMEEILRTAHTSVSYQCRKLLRDPRNAEDATQEVLLTVYTRLGNLKNPAAFWGWLNTTTANRCMDVLRRDNVELQFAEDEEGHSVLDSLEELDEQSVPDKSLDNAETTRMIEEIVNSLPEAQRICVLMYYYDEMSVKDIAAALGVPENTVKSRLNYARKAIKEQVLDYEKKGVKLYGLSPLPFMLYFLLRAAEETADSAAAEVMAKKAVELGAAAAAGAGGTAAAGAAAGGKAAAGAAVGSGKAAAGAAAGGKAVGTALSAKFIAGSLATLLTVGGVTAAVVIPQNQAEPELTPPPAITETIPLETEPEETAAPEPTETPPVEEEPIPAERLALLNDITYYGDPAQCRMTVSQAIAYAEVLEASDDAPYAALIDIGEGNPVLALARGTSTDGYAVSGDPGPDFVPDPDLDGFVGKLEVWRYADGQAEQVTAAHAVRWKEGQGLVCHTRVGGTEDESGNVLPMEAQPHYLDYVEDVYSAEGGALSVSPISSAYAEVDPGPGIVSGGTIDGQPVGEEGWLAWERQWDGDGWTSIGTGYDPIIGGHVDDGILNIRTVSPGADTAAVLRRCAGE